MMMRWTAVAALLRVATPQCGSYASVTVVGRAPRAGVPLAEGCKYVYLDFGGHHGVQARKIFEQRRYATTNPKKMVMYEHWDAAFGELRELWKKDVCVVGFEPNRHHEPRLRELAQRYTARGWRTTYFVAGIGVADELRPYSISLDFNATTTNDMMFTGSLSRGDTKCDGSLVPVVDVAAFLETHVLPATSVEGVLAKLDVEGSEYAVVKRVVERRLECAASVWAVEWHEASPVPGVDARKKQDALRGARKCTTILEVDDEAFAWDPFPLPERLDASAGAFDPWSVYNVKDHGVFWLHGMKPHKEVAKRRSFKDTMRIQQARRRKPN